MTAVGSLAQFAVTAPYDELSETARQQLKIRILEALGCTIGAMESEPVRIALIFRARLGITGPLEVIEGEKGLMDAITGFFEIDWSRETSSGSSAPS